jgi:two-component sensor histidine kinase
MDQLLNADELVRETRHRVKNSLQLVASMLSAQARQSRDVSVAAGLREAVSRITVVAHLHENLQYADEQMVRLADYLRDICNDLALTAGTTEGRGGVHLHADAIVLPGPDAVAVGLITNELVTNALRHAYPSGAGPVEVTLARNGGRFVLTVADKGAGRFGSAEGLGLTFVRLLARKLHGEIEFSEARPGTCARLSFLGSIARAAAN